MNKKTVILIIILVAVIGIIFTGIMGTDPDTDPAVLSSRLEFNISTDASGKKVLYFDESVTVDEPYRLMEHIILELDDGTTVVLDESNVNQYLDFTVETNDRLLVTVNSFGTVTFSKEVYCSVTVKTKDLSGLSDTVYFKKQTSGDSDIDPDF